MPDMKKNIGPVAQPDTAPIRNAASDRLRPLPGGSNLALDPVAAAASSAASDTGAAKPAKPKRVKLHRHSYSISKIEYAALQALKERASTLGRGARKSELLRAGIKTLAAMTDEALLASLAGVPETRRKRPAKD